MEILGRARPDVETEFSHTASMYKIRPLTTCDCDFSWRFGLKAPSASPLLMAADLRWAGRALLSFDAMLRDYGGEEEGVSMIR